MWGRFTMMDYSFQSPIGQLQIRIEDDAITQINYSNRKYSLLPKRFRSQFDAYFSDASFSFDVPLNLEGTPYQQRVWQALQKIPAGEVLTYGELAVKLKSGARAIGNACRRNPIPIVVPCHRVVAKSHMGGYSGKTSGRIFDKKLWLLKHEGYC